MKRGTLTSLLHCVQSKLPPLPPKRLQWLLEPLFQDGVQKGLPHLMRKLDASVRNGDGAVDECARMVVDLATSAGAVTLAEAARAYGDSPSAQTAQALRHEYTRTVRALQAHGILSPRRSPVYLPDEWADLVQQAAERGSPSV